ncbi:hypothetical protein [Carboxylicivirga linearis]|uniref:Uncharacterized protein n=1 Tax=Carboxylicivirga linearis TaxID=1628157 RepID=A0ABS5JY88_9BACT|nr:hypothetical protein [Carboxylicivirga linearis]MBS2099848.1 hypothetical protein [Carboxylicivirga linearis]
MKKLFLLMAIMATAFAFQACDKDDVQPEDKTIDTNLRAGGDPEESGGLIIEYEGGDV